MSDIRTFTPRPAPPPAPRAPQAPAIDPSQASGHLQIAWEAWRQRMPLYLLNGLK